ncbi:MAG: hypothetical protein IJ366_04940 [Clostridia bacterium]|nr:hypothetical protein [Clostridia bacterium]
MTLKNAVNELMDFAKVHEVDVHTAYAKIAYEIKTGERDFMTMAELDEAKAFVDENYDVVVEARKSGNDADYDTALHLWGKEN